uniref:YqaJ viral recombinase domain-containing protein n=1 Tax=Sinocyclocheilus anshuiensis TaxID=1608454 RepID=A0A671S172_9TELE
MFCQGITPEPVDELVVRKPKASGRSSVQSTLYKAYGGTLQILIKHIFEICPAVLPIDVLTHPNAAEFPPLPVPQYTLPQYHFVPGSFMHMQSLEVTPEMSGIIEEGTRDQSKSPLWFSMRRLWLTASKFYEAARVRSESTAKTLAGRIIKGAPQTKAMRRGVELEPEVLRRYAETFNVNVLPCGLIIHPEAPHLGASPDGKVVDPNEDPPYGLVEVKCPDVKDIGEASHTEFVGGQANLRKSHTYHWQVQGQLMVTGLSWCDLVTNTRGDFTVERVWRNDELIQEIKAKADEFYFGTYIHVLLGRKYARSVA